MAGHENSYVIRLPESFWQRLVELKYVDKNASETTAAAFNNAERRVSGSGHARFITGSHQTLGRVLAQLYNLAREIEAGEYRARESFGVNRADIERYARQRITAVPAVRIIGEPDESEGT